MGYLWHVRGPWHLRLVPRNWMDLEKLGNHVQVPQPLCGQSQSLEAGDGLSSIVQVPCGGDRNQLGCMASSGNQVESDPGWRTMIL